MIGGIEAIESDDPAEAGVDLARGRCGLREARRAYEVSTGEARLRFAIKFSRRPRSTFLK